MLEGGDRSSSGPSIECLGFGDYAIMIGVISALRAANKGKMSVFHEICHCQMNRSGAAAKHMRQYALCTSDHNDSVQFKLCPSLGRDDPVCHCVCNSLGQARERAVKYDLIPPMLLYTF